MNETELIAKYTEELQQLIRKAKADRIVLGIDLKPTEPLRMGGYKMVPHVRPARKMAE